MKRSVQVSMIWPSHSWGQQCTFVLPAPIFKYNPYCSATTIILRDKYTSIHNCLHTHCMYTYLHAYRWRRIGALASLFNIPINLTLLLVVPIINTTKNHKQVIPISTFSVSLFLFLFSYYFFFLFLDEWDNFYRKEQKNYKTLCLPAGTRLLNKP